MLLKVWSENHQHEHYLGACWKCRIPDPTPGLLNQVYSYTHEIFGSTTKNLCPCEYLTWRESFTKYLYNLCLIMSFWLRFSPIFGCSYWCISPGYPSIEWWLQPQKHISHISTGCIWGQGMRMVGFWWRLSLWPVDGYLLAGSLHREEWGISSLISVLIRALIPSPGFQLHDLTSTQYLPKAPSLK